MNFSTVTMITESCSTSYLVYIFTCLAARATLLDYLHQVCMKLSGVEKD